MTVARAYLLAGLAAIAVYFTLPWNSFAQTLVYDAIGASAAAASVAGARLFRPSLRLPWYLFAAGLLAFSVGDVLFNLYAFVWHRDVPVPSAADVFYLAGYPFLTAGLILLVRCLRREERRGGGIDAAMLIVAFALCQWVFIMQDRLHAGSIGERVVALSYPAMDVLLLAALVFFALTPTWRTVSYRYLAASIVLLLFADELYGLSPETYANASWLDAFWLLSYVLWGVAALHPSMRELSKPARSGGPRVSTRRFALLAGALAGARAVGRRGRDAAATAPRRGASRHAGARGRERVEVALGDLVSHAVRAPLTRATAYGEPLMGAGSRSELRATTSRKPRTSE